MTAPSRSSSVVSVAVAALAISGALWSGDASADPSPADRQAATTLFKEGKALLDKGSIADACRKFEASQRLDPAAGTLLNLAVCHEKEGRTASAWYEFTDALAAARKDNRTERIKLAEEHIAKLEPLLIRLTIDVPKANEVPDLEVRRDGAALARAGWGIATPIDPGEHKIEARAKGRLPFTQTLQLDAKEPTKTLTIPALEIDPEAAKAAASAAPTETAAPPPPIAPPPPAEASHRGRNGAITTAVGGVVLVGAGVVGFLAKSKWDNAQDACPRKESCSAGGSDETKKAGKLADTATGLGVIGAVVTGIGVYLLSTSPAQPSSAAATATRRPRLQPSLSVGPSGGGAFLSGSF
jgi:hypothetical protein